MPFAGTWEPGTLDFSGSGATQKTPLSANGLAELLPDSGEQVHVTGHIATELETDCDRCLGRASYPVDTDIDLYYKPASSVNTEESEVAIDEGEAEIGFYELPGLELDQILTEQVLLQLPMQHVCSESCKGICPHLRGEPQRNGVSVQRCEGKPDRGYPVAGPERHSRLI